MEKMEEMEEMEVMEEMEESTPLTTQEMPKDPPKKKMYAKRPVERKELPTATTETEGPSTPAAEGWLHLPSWNTWIYVSVGSVGSVAVVALVIIALCVWKFSKKCVRKCKRCGQKCKRRGNDNKIAVCCVKGACDACLMPCRKLDECRGKQAYRRTSSNESVEYASFV